MTFHNSFFSMAFLAVYVVPPTLISMLPPRVQKNIDLRNLLEFIETHDEITATLRSINLDNNTVVFGSSGECIAYFDRKTTHPLIGGAADLEFIESNCDFILKTKSSKPLKSINFLQLD